MTIMMSCCCEKEAPCDCPLEETIKALLAADDDFAAVNLFTGGLAAAADLGGASGPALPYGVLSALGANNSRRIGDGCYQHEVIVRLRLFTKTDKEGIQLAMASSEALRAAGTICTLEGRAVLRSVPPWPAVGKMAHAAWMTQVNLPWLVRSHAA